MILPDVNVLIFACHQESVRHSEYKAWLENALTSGVPVGISDTVLSSVMRICTNPRVFRYPLSIREITDYCALLRNHPGAVRVVPGGRHWDIFIRLCEDGDARGNLVADAYLAAMAMEAGAEWITTDRDFARFQGLRWRQPF